MPDKIQSQKILCEGGLNNSENSLILSDTSPGAATRLVNYETSLSGGYRRINGFIKYDEDFPEVGVGVAEGPILGVWIFHNTTTNEDVVIAARKTIGVTTYKFYFFTLGVGWTPFVTGLTHNTVHATSGDNILRIRADIFNFGTVDHICFVDGINQAVIYDGTSWYQLSSANAGTSVSPGGDQVVDRPSIVSGSYKSTLFLGGDPDFPGIISYSTASDPFDFTAASGGGQLIPGFDVVQIKPWRNFLYVFGKTHIHKAEADVSAGFLLSDVTSDLGCIARDSIIELAGNLLFLSADGIRPIAGTANNDGDVELALLSQDIQFLIDFILENNDLTVLNSVTIRKKTQFRYFLADSDDEVSESTGLIGSYRTKGQNGPRWEFGELLGIRANCAWSGIVGTTEIILHGDHDGIVYKQEEGNSFDGANIIGIYNTPYIDYGDTEIRKTMRKLNTFLRCEGSLTINIGVSYDWGDLNVINPSDYTGISVNGPATFDSGFLFDDPDSIFGGASRNVITTNIQGSCFSARFSFVTDGVYAPHTIQGFTTEFSVKGRE